MWDQRCWRQKIWHFSSTCPLCQPISCVRELEETYYASSKQVVKCVLCRVPVQSRQFTVAVSSRLRKTLLLLSTTKPVNLSSKGLRANSTSSGMLDRAAIFNEYLIEQLFKNFNLLQNLNLACPCSPVV